MTNPYDAPQAANENAAPKQSRFGIGMLLVFLLLIAFGGCAAGLIFYQTPAAIPPPGPAQQVPTTPVSAE